MQFERQARRARHINLTPLIDVVFLLIVFFMMSTSFVMSESIELLLPSSGASDVVLEDVAELHVRTDGSVRYNDQRYDANALDRLIRRMLRDNPEQKILLLSTPGVKVQELVTVMDLIYVNGGRNVQIDHLYKGRRPDIGHDVKLAE